MSFGLARKQIGDRLRSLKAADTIAVLTGVALPWSTSATAILVAAGAVVLLCTLDPSDARRAVSTPAGAFPLALLVLAILGVLWSESALPGTLQGVRPYLKMLALPLVLAHFMRSDAAGKVIIGFVASCAVLLVVSWVHALWLYEAAYPNGLLRGKSRGVLVKDYIAQSGFFVMAVAILAPITLDAIRQRRWPAAVALLTVTAGFVADIFYVATGRTAFAVIPVLALIFAFREFGWKGLMSAIVGGTLLFGAIWTTSPYLRDRFSIGTELEISDGTNAEQQVTRADLWSRSVQLVLRKPLIGHGTEPRTTVTDHAGRKTAEYIDNPHNQTLAIAIQLGTLGVLLLYGMWTAHLACFRGAGFLRWIGTAIVVQNVVSSLFNSHLFDFTQGWFYVIFVGMLAGAVSSRGPRTAP